MEDVCPNCEGAKTIRGVVDPTTLSYIDCPECAGQGVKTYVSLQPMGDLFVLEFGSELYYVDADYALTLKPILESAIRYGRTLAFQEMQAFLTDAQEVSS